MTLMYPNRSSNDDPTATGDDDRFGVPRHRGLQGTQGVGTMLHDVKMGQML